MFSKIMFKIAPEKSGRCLTAEEYSEQILERCWGQDRLLLLLVIYNIIKKKISTD
jgi:hypothetical protein